METLVADLQQIRSASAVRQWLSGVALPFRAVALLRRHRSLWPWAAAPALLGGLLFLGVATGALAYADDLLALWWAPPAAETVGTTLLYAVWALLYALLLVAGLVGAYLTALLLGGIIASPVNDALSIRTEQVLVRDGHRPEEVPLWTGMLRSIVSTAAITGLYLACAVPILLLNLVPGVGPPLATVLHAGLASFFLAAEYADTAFARFGLSWRQKLSLLRQHRELAAGFGLSTSLLLWIPGLNLLVMPIAVIGGTALGLALYGVNERV